MTASKILLLGFGNMGQALANGWSANGVSTSDIAIVDPHDDARSAARAMGASLVTAAAAAAYEADVVVVAVKPVQLEEALGPLAASIRDYVVLSIVAGKTTAQIARVLGRPAAVVRAMPNTPAAIGQGATALYARPEVSQAQRDLCARLMGAVGEVEWLPDEALMDAVTALSGSGPAYVFLLIECLADAGRELGLEPGLAARLATATVAGAGAYARQSGLPAAELRRRVTSPSGTTEAALAVLGSPDGLAELVRRAMQAAAARSRELSRD